MKKYILTMIMLALFSFGPRAAAEPAEPAETGQLSDDTSVITDEDREIAEMMEMLALMEILKEMELMKDYDLFAEEETDEKEN